jgi:transcriptional regulator with XRE-family HTH domain
MQIRREALIKRRKSRDLTQADVARRIGVSVSTVQSVEVGRDNPSYKVMEKWAALLGCSMNLFHVDRPKSEAEGAA